MKAERKRRLINGSMVAALVAAVAVFGVMLQIEKNTLAAYEKAPILVAAREIPKGQLITEENREDYLKEVMLEKSAIPDTAICKVEQVAGLAASVTVTEGAYLMSDMFEKLNDITEQMSEPVVAGLRAEDLYQVVGGVLRAGDRIHIYRVDEEGKAVLAWENVYVQGVFDQSGTAISNEDRNTAAQRINVYLDKKAVEEFYSQLNAGALRIVKREDV